MSLIVELGAIYGVLSITAFGVTKIIRFFTTDDQIQGAVDPAREAVQSRLGTWLEIDPKTDYISANVIRSYLESFRFRRSTIIVRDAGINPRFVLPTGTYETEHNFVNDQNVIVDTIRLFTTITDNKICIKGPRDSHDKMERFILNLYRRYNAPSVVAYIFNSSSKGWGEPNPFRPIVIREQSVTDDMRRFLTHVTGQYLTDVELRERRSGYMLVSEPGCGKTTCIQILQRMLDMKIYMIHLNGIKMDDSKLSKLICAIPPRSLIVIEEIEKQLAALEKNSSCFISKGGIILSFDGPARTSFESLVVVTCNDIELINPTFKQQLIRPGRLGTPFVFTQTYTY